MKTSSSYEDFLKAKMAASSCLDEETVARLKAQWAKSVRNADNFLKSHWYRRNAVQTSSLMAVGASHNVTIFGQGVVQKSFSDYFEVLLQPQNVAPGTQFQALMTSAWLNVKAGANVDMDVTTYLKELINLKFPGAPSQHSVHDVEQFAADEFDYAVSSWGGGPMAGIFFNGMGRCVYATNSPQNDAQKRWVVIGSTPVAPTSSPGTPGTATQPPSAPGPFNPAGANLPPQTIPLIPEEPRVIRATTSPVPSGGSISGGGYPATRLSVMYDLWAVTRVGASPVHLYVAHNLIKINFSIELEVILASDCDYIMVKADGFLLSQRVNGPFPAGSTLQIVDTGGKVTLKSWQVAAGTYSVPIVESPTTIHRDEELTFQEMPPLTPSQIAQMKQDIEKASLITTATGLTPTTRCYLCGKPDNRVMMLRTSGGAAVCSPCWKQEGL